MRTKFSQGIVYIGKEQNAVVVTPGSNNTLTETH